MKNQHPHRLICSLLLSLAFFSSCSGQNKKPSGTITSAYPTIIRTQGTNKYDAVSRGFQDKAGNLWFGTGGEGVYRYDGTSFTNFTTQDGLSSNSVAAVFEDKAGNIWLGTDAGLCRYNPSAASAATASQPLFTSIPITIGNNTSFTGITSPGTRPAIICIMQDKIGKLWLGTRDDGIYCYDGTSFTHFLHNDGVINNNGLQLKAVQAIIEDKAGNIWFTTWFEGICRFDGTSITNFKPNGEVWFSGMLQDRDGNIWVGRRDKGVVRYNGTDFTNVRQHGTFDSCGIGPIVQDRSGNIWFGTEYTDLSRRETLGGLWRYDGKTFKNYTTRDGLTNMTVFSLTLDKSGKLWTGTRNMGLSSFDGKTFTDYSDKRSKGIRRIFRDHAGNLWFATNGDGICRYHPSAAGAASVTYFNTTDGLSGSDVRCVAEDNKGHLWFGTNAGLSRFDGKHFTNFTTHDGLPASDVWSILIDKTGSVWAGTVEGICCSTPSATSPGTFTRFPIPPATENDFSRSVAGTRIVWDIKEDHAGNIWFATNGSGVFSWNGRSLTNISEKDGLCSNFVNSILEDRHGDLWFATQHAGVTRYHPATSSSPSSKPFTTFTENDGLGSSEVGTMAQDQAGIIWLSTRGSLSRFDGNTFTSFPGNTEPHTTQVRNYIQAVCPDSSGTLWLGTSGGLYRFDGKTLINLTKEWTRGAL